MPFNTSSSKLLKVNRQDERPTTPLSISPPKPQIMNKQQERSVMGAAMMLHKSSRRPAKPPSNSCSQTSTATKATESRSKDKSALSSREASWQLERRQIEILDEIRELEIAIQGASGEKARENIATLQLRNQELRRVKEQIIECQGVGCLQKHKHLIIRSSPARFPVASPDAKSSATPPVTSPAATTSSISQRRSSTKPSPIQSTLEGFNVDRQETLRRIEYLRGQVNATTNRTKLQYMSDLADAEVQLERIQNCIALCSAAERRELRGKKAGVSRREDNQMGPMSGTKTREGDSPAMASETESESDGGTTESTNSSVVVEERSLPILEDFQRTHFERDIEDTRH